MKKYALFTLFLLPLGMLYAQRVAVSGNIISNGGKPVPFAFVRDSEHSIATYADSTGAYSLKPFAGAQLVVTAAGYNQASAPVKGGVQNFTLVAGRAAVQPATQVAANVFNQHADATTMMIGTFRYSTTEVQGSQYLSPDWMHGYGISVQDSLIQKPQYLFNYDLLNGDLLYTPDAGATVYKPGKQDLKQFTLYGNGSWVYTFENVPAIDNSHYVQVIAAGEKYKIYKKFIIKYIKANYQSNGIAATGNKYDEYVQENTYYLVKGNNQPIKFIPKKKVLKELFAADAEKANKYMSSASGDLDDAYLKGLGEAVNE